jgi:flagellar M-ring protein FliF
MKEKLQAWAKKAWTDFQGFSAGQKAVTVIAVVALLVGGYYLATWKSSPSYAPLYNNLAASDASSIVSKLQSEGVPYKLGNGGAEILVPTDKVDAARLSISAAGLPNNGQSGYSLLDKEGVTTSQFQQQVDYQRAVEGELAKTIESISGVQAASVHLAIPQQDVFNDGSVAPTAAVLITATPGTTLTTAQVQSVVNLVSSSVTGMKSTGVTVSDSNGDVLSAPGGAAGGAASASTQTDMTTAYQDRVANSLQAMLDKSLGQGHSQVQVLAALNFDSTKTTKNGYVYTPNTPPVSETINKENYSGANANPSGGGTLGTTDTVGSGGSGSANGKYSKESTTVNNALSTVSSTTESAPGSLKNLNIAVELDKSAKGLNVNAITQLVKAGVGFNATRGDTLSVQAVSFDNSAQTAAGASAKAAAKAAAAKAAHAQMMSYLKTGVLVLLILVIALSAWLSSRKRRKNGGDDDHEPGIDFLDDMTGGAEASADRNPVTAADAKDSVSVRRDLASVADNRPEDVARVLSAWLNSKENAR